MKSLLSINSNPFPSASSFLHLSYESKVDSRDTPPNILNDLAPRHNCEINKNPLIVNKKPFSKKTSAKSIEQLMQAAREGELFKIKLLDKEGVDLSAIDENGNTAAHYAVKYGETEILRFLITKGAAINLRNQQGKTPWDIVEPAYSTTKDFLSLYLLMKATLEGDLPNIEALAQKGINLNAVDVRGNSAAHYAVEYKKIEILRFLITEGADINICNQYGKTPWDIAETINSPEIKTELSNGGALSATQLLMEAVQKGELSSIEALTQKGVSLDAVDEKGNSAAHYAVKYGKIEILRFLITQRANINLRNNQGDTLWDIAEKLGHSTIQDFLGPYFLMHAAKKKDLPNIEALAQKGINFNAVDVRGNSAAHYAVEYKKIEILRFLITEGADINICNQYGKTPWDIAETINSPEIKTELSNGGALSATQLLMEAVQKGELSSIEALTQKGVSLDAVDEKGNSAAHYAVKYGKIEILRFLITQGANINIFNKQGKTPRDIAKNLIHPLAMAKLQEAGAVYAEKFLRDAITAKDLEKIEALAKKNVDFNTKLLNESLYKLVDFAILEQNDPAIQALFKIWINALKDQDNIKENTSDIREKNPSNISAWYEKNISLIRCALSDCNYEPLSMLIKIAADELRTLENISEKSSDLNKPNYSLAKPFFKDLEGLLSTAIDKEDGNKIQLLIDMVGEVFKIPAHKISTHTVEWHKKSIPLLRYALENYDYKSAQKFINVYKNELRALEKVNEKLPNTTELTNCLVEMFIENLAKLSLAIRHNDRNEIQRLIKWCDNALNGPGDIINEGLKNKSQNNETPINLYVKNSRLLLSALKNKSNKAIPFLIEMQKYEFDPNEFDPSKIDYLRDQREKNLSLLDFITSNSYDAVIPSLFREFHTPKHY